MRQRPLGSSSHALRPQGLGQTQNGTSDVYGRVPSSPWVLQSIVSMITPQLHNVDIEDMAPESGAVIQKNFRKVAMYKDAEGRKHAFSALCPHLGCLLQVRQGFIHTLLIDLLLSCSKHAFPALCSHLGCLLQVEHTFTQFFTQLLLMSLLMPCSKAVDAFTQPPSMHHMQSCSKDANVKEHACMALCTYLGCSPWVAVCFGWVALTSTTPVCYPHVLLLCATPVCYPCVLLMCATPVCYSCMLTLCALMCATHVCYGMQYCLVI